MPDVAEVALVAAAGLVGGAMNALAGGGTFATMPALLAVGTPANIANATSNLALLPGAGASAWAFRDELRPVGGVPVRLLAGITFVAGLAGSVLLVKTPPRAFDLIVPWLLFVAMLAIIFGRRGAEWLGARVTIGRRTLLIAQGLLGIYGGYFGGGLGIMTTATYGLLAGESPRTMFAPRTLMLAAANFAAAFVFITVGLVRWSACLPMLAGGLVGGWLGAGIGPEHSWLKDTGRVEYVPIMDTEALAAFQTLTRLEGIIPALEPAHALAEVIKRAPTMDREQIIVMNLCGRGDKDVFTAARHLGVDL